MLAQSSGRSPGEKERKELFYLTDPRDIVVCWQLPASVAQVAKNELC
jgi:hypothetical protein